jgi:hypothetical protein
MTMQLAIVAVNLPRIKIVTPAVRGTAEEKAVSEDTAKPLLAKVSKTL